MIRGKFLTDVKFLWLEQILELRSYWVFYLAFSLVFPLIMVFGFSRFGGETTDPDALLRLIGGAAIFSIANEGISSMAVRVTTMRREGMLLYYASLPISKVSLIVALVLARFIIVLPGLLAPIILAPVLYHVNIYYDPTLLLLIPLLALLFSTIGIAFGLVAGTVEIAQLATNALLFVLVLASPVFIPWDALPDILRYSSLIFPFTYAADALDMALTGALGARFWIDVAVLSGMLLAALFIMERRFRWRLE